MTVDDATLYSRSPEPVALDDGGEAVMFSAERREYYRLDPVGTAIWNLIATPSTLEEIVDVLCLAFGVGAEECRPEVRRFLALLVENGLARTTGGGR